MNIGYDELYNACKELVKLQAHYAQLLNMHDGGRRREFKSVEEYVARLREMDKKK